MDKKMIKNLKTIYGIDMIAFAIILSLHLFVDKFNFNDFWCLFVVGPSLADIILNKGNIFNLSVFIISLSIFGYFIFNTPWACLIILFILIGLLLLFGNYIVKNVNNEKDAK